LPESIICPSVGQGSPERWVCTNGSKPASSNTCAVCQADFYRAGDGIDESFTAQMIVSTDDIAPDILGVQNVWVQGVGGATAVVHFGS
jgi:hypothetical protein